MIKNEIIFIRIKKYIYGKCNIFEWVSPTSNKSIRPPTHCLLLTNLKPFQHLCIQGLRRIQDILWCSLSHSGIMSSYSSCAFYIHEGLVYDFIITESHLGIKALCFYEFWWNLLSRINLFCILLFFWISSSAKSVWQRADIFLSVAQLLYKEMVDAIKGKDVNEGLEHWLSLLNLCRQIFIFCQWQLWWVLWCKRG